MARVLRWLVRPLQALLEMRGALFPWVPVFLGCGIGVWFGVESEPGLLVYGLVGGGLMLAAVAWRWGPELAHPLVAIVACLSVGFVVAGARAHLVAAPMLDRPYFGPVLGRVIEIDRSQSDALRLTLDRVVLGDLSPAETPKSVRISFQAATVVPDPGQVVMVTARLAAPDGPTEPGGFDFRRMAYFDGLGAVGYTRNPLLLWEEPGDGVQMINRFRMYLSRGIMAAVPGDAGAFASGAMTGDRSGITKDTVEALRDSNLAHLLAISGMNMAFLTGFVFVFLRYGLAVFPVIALRVNTKKLAAAVAFAVALFYLLLSGANVATERAFLMVSVMLGAVLIDRRALTLRSVALSAVVLLIWQPESLTEPGFQLSFAATVALIAAFGALDRRVMRDRLPRWILPLFTLVLSSVVAGVATAPYAAATFNRFTDYGLLANLLTAPSMSLLMAAGAVAALLAPFGLAGPALWLMGLAARWILFIAHWVAGLDGAVTPIVAPGPWVIPLITFAGCWLILMRGRPRLVAAVPFALAFGIWLQVERPVLLISGDGALVGLLGPQGRALSAQNGAGFTARNWLEKDGDLATQDDAFVRSGFSRLKIPGPGAMQSFVLTPPNASGTPDESCDQGTVCPGVFRGVAMSGKAADVASACAVADLVILSQTVPKPINLAPGCIVIDHDLLRQTGALALVFNGQGWDFKPARREARIWMGQKTPLMLPTF